MTPTRAALFDAMGHDEVVDAACDEAVRWSWRAFAPDRVKTSRDDHRTAYRHESGKGFPDITIVNCRWVAFVEVKTGRATLGPEQRQWRDLVLDVEDMPGSRVLHVVLRPTGLPRFFEFLRSSDPAWLAQP